MLSIFRIIGKKLLKAKIITNQCFHFCAYYIFIFLVGKMNKNLAKNASECEATNSNASKKNDLLNLTSKVIRIVQFSFHLCINV